MDRKEYLKQLLLNKRPNLEANLTQKVDERKQAYTLNRKAKKDMRDVGRRNIDKMSPFCTPISEKATQTSGKAALEQQKHVINPKENSNEVNKRLEMLAKWKAEKSSKQKPTNQRPVFKVCHLSSDSTTSLENANKFIKGKLIAPTTYKSKFAPAGHRFKAPSTVKKIGTTPKELLEHKPTAETNGAKTVGFRNTARNNTTNTTGIISTLRRSDRIKCKIGNLKNNNGPAENPASGISEAATKVSKKGLRNKMPTVLEGDEAPSTSRVPDLLKEEGACSETPDNNKTDNLSDLNNQSTPMRDESLGVTKSKGKGRIKTAPYKKGVKSNTPTVSDVEELLEDFTTDLHESPNILACGSANKSKGKEKTTTYKKAVRSSTPVGDLEEVLHDDLLESVCYSANKSQEQGTFCKSAPDNIDNLVVFEAVVNEKLEVSHSTPVDKTPVLSKPKGKKKEKRTPHKKSSKISTPVPYDDEVLHDITLDVQNCENTSASKSPFESKGVTKKRKSVQAVKKESLKNTDDFKKLTEKTAAEHDQKQVHTPIYLSPFVTKARGKQNSINEFKLRRSIDVSMKNTDIDVANLINIHTSPVAAADYFMVKLNAEIVKINQMCEKWEKCLQEPDLPEEAIPSINVVIGQSQLLITKKFEQFRQLIVQCKNQDLTENCHIKCDDLHGFWDMTYLQVEDLEKRFDNLDRFKENNWVEMLPVKAVNKKLAKTRVKKPVANSRLKEMIKAAREHRSTLKSTLAGDCLKAKTPTRDQQTPEPQRQSTSKRRSSRVSLLAEKETKSSPGLAMMKLSQSIKHGNGLTPVKSILKVERLKSTGKKSVTFGQLVSPAINITPKDLFRGKENTPRRLRRSHNRMADPGS